MHKVIVVGMLLALSSIAGAQPGAYPPSSPMGPPGYGPPPPVYQLTPEDREILDEPYTPPMTTAISGAAAVVIGFGLGQAIEGRYSDTGWIFTLGEGGSLAAMIAGAVGFNRCVLGAACNQNSGAVALLVGGALAYTGFHIWDVLDAFIAPSRQNARIREVRRKYGMPPVVPYAGVPQGGQSGMTAGLAFQF